MPAPTLTATGQRLYDELAPLAGDDAAHGYALAQFCGALALLLDDVADLTADTDDPSQPSGWERVFDVDTIPAPWLPWLAQFVGVQLPPNLDEAAQRERIKATDGFKRGTPAAMIAAARPFLTGTQTVYLTERHGSPYRLTLATLTSETPDPAAVAEAVREQKPAGLVLAVTTVPGGDFDSLRDTHTDFDDVASTFADFDELRADPTAT